MKQNVLLAKLEHSAAQFRELVKGYIQTFGKSQATQNVFRGIRQTYQAKGDYLDEPSKRGNTPVQNTVSEYLKYLVDHAAPHLTNLFNVEATNASGTAKARLIVDDIDFGELSTLELLRLKSFLDQQELNTMYSTLPVRPDTQTWKLSEDEEYKGKGIYETETFQNPNRTTLKEAYILPDPNIQHIKDASRYTPQVVTKDTQIVMGEQTVQWFTGETSHRERAAILSRLTNLKGAVRQALEEANHAEVIPSQLTAEKIFNYLHNVKG